MIPPLLNDFIALMKDTSLVSVLGAVEVVQAGRDIQSDTFNGSGLIFGAIPVPDRDDPARPPGRLADRAGAAQVSAAAADSGDDDGPGRAAAQHWRRGARPAHRRLARPRTTAGRCSPRRRLQALRQARGAARRRPRGPAGRGRLRARAERLGQVDAAALHQPARAARGGSHPARGPGDHRCRRHRGSRLRPPAGRDGVPAVQPVPAQVRDRQRPPRAGEGARPLRRRRRREGEVAARPGRHRREVRRVPRPALRRPAAAGRDRPRARDGPDSDALRRGHLGARPGAGQGGARRDARARR